MRSLKLAAAAFVVLFITMSSAAAQALPAQEWEAIAAAEDARAATPAQLRTLLDGTRNSSIEIRRISIRALGRLQRLELADTIARSLRDSSPLIRAEAARALALAAIADRAPAAVRDTVRSALARESDEVVIGALAETLGRLRNANADSARITAAALITLVDLGTAARLGAVRGLHFVARQSPAIRAGLDTARAALIRVATDRSGTTDAAIRARRLATATLALTAMSDEQTALQIMDDTDAFVRREAIFMTTSLTRDTAAMRRLIARGLRDSYWMVRYDALRQYGTRLGAAARCSTVQPYLRDTSMHVRVEAIDIMGARCIADAATISMLDSIARALPPTGSGAWHAAAHAIVALAKRDTARAQRRMNAFIRHPNLFVRTYAATAAGQLRDTATLRRLAFDVHPNVRTASVLGLRRLVGHTADTVYLAQLALDDGQLLMEAAAALDSTTHPGVAVRMLDALDRVSAHMRENSRDGRDALLNVIGHIGSPALAPRMLPYLRDFDPQIATHAASILKAWTGTEHTAAPERLPPEPMPTYTEATALAAARLRVQMESGLVFDVKLLPFDAPTNAARFARLARQGWFNGLTLHRVEPSFVVQGGSPNANEYAGAPRFSRDEIGYPNNRGTIGLSTRGHDTGDAQIFINTIDNTQLDPLYTVFAVVSSAAGLTAVDRIMEGAAIRRITWVR